MLHSTADKFRWTTGSPGRWLEWAGGREEREKKGDARLIWAFPILPHPGPGFHKSGVKPRQGCRYSVSALAPVVPIPVPRSILGLAPKEQFRLVTQHTHTHAHNPWTEIFCSLADVIFSEHAYSLISRTPGKTLSSGGLSTTGRGSDKATKRA